MGRTGSTLILLVVALGLGGYLYFVESERPVADENAKAKVFTYDAAKINQVQIKSSSGEVTALRKGANDTWTIVQPVAGAGGSQQRQRSRHESGEPRRRSRVVDENAADLKAYGLAEPRIDVTFHVDGEKEPKRILLGEKNADRTSASTRSFRRAIESSSSATALETAADKSTFDFRDKAALAVRAGPR